MDVHSGTRKDVLDNPDDASDDSVSGPTDKEDESDTEKAAQTNEDNDDDDNDDHGDDQNPSPALHIVVVSDVGASEAGVTSDIPCDPPVTQEEEIRMDAGVQVKNENVSLSEGGEKENGESESGDKNKDETPIQTESNQVPHNLGVNICCYPPLKKT